jgi:hypothetical protein
MGMREADRTAMGLVFGVEAKGLNPFHRVAHSMSLSSFKLRPMTSPPEPITVICSACDFKFDSWFRPSINLNLDHFDDEELDAMNSAICPKCGHKNELPSMLVKGSTFYLT